MNKPELLRYVPAWLPPDQCAAFTGRLAAAFDRYRVAHGLWSLSDAMVRRVIGGVAAAFKGKRLDRRGGAACSQSAAGRLVFVRSLRRAAQSFGALRTIGALVAGQG